MEKKMPRPPANLRGMSPEFAADSARLANEFATPGTVKHFALRLGYMPHDEVAAEAIIKRCLAEGEWWEQQYENLLLYGQEAG